MQNVGGKSPVLAAHAGVKQTHDKIGVFQSPTGVGGVEPVDAIEVGAADGEIAGLRTLPSHCAATGAAARAQDAAPAAGD